ncbi:hypothetical protein MANES_07G075015v8 [Manihot esculenta]|uniref:Uncharacterized protein n=1 Tax=Manihot esculenta TaxID=3983 RepID=A0ACB7HDN3_MANES|nr:hypothetical protein MANES_07G075015v8 [Manihot esculenta]
MISPSNRRPDRTTTTTCTATVACMLPTKLDRHAKRPLLMMEIVLVNGKRNREEWSPSRFPSTKKTKWLIGATSVGRGRATVMRSAGRRMAARAKGLRLSQGCRMKLLYVAAYHGFLCDVVDLAHVSARRAIGRGASVAHPSVGWTSRQLCKKTWAAGVLLKEEDEFLPKL